MTRADALRDLIAAVEAGSLSDLTIATFDGAGMGTEFWSAFNHSLDAVARLEAPLRERGWQGPDVCAPWLRRGEWAPWSAAWSGDSLSPADPCPEGEAPTEARARLLAVLRALLSEEPRDPA